jgi:cation:H+ antiporter
MFLSFIIVIIGFIILSYGAIFLVDGSASLANKFKITQIVIGLTIVAFGTSAPELLVNVISSFKKEYDIGFGNIIGSNLFNILVVLGVAAVIQPLTVQKNTVWKQIPFLFFGTVLVFGFLNNFGFKGNTLSRIDGIFLISVLIIFYVLTLKEHLTEKMDFEIPNYSVLRSAILIIIGIVGLYFGAKLVVDNTVKIALGFHVSPKLIALTMVAFGTSLPELVTSIVAVLRKNNDLAIGNVVGSNLFNLFFILGVSSLITPMKYNPVLNADYVLLIVITFLLFLTMFTGKKHKLDRWEAIIFLILYVGYTYLIIIRK